MTGGRNREGGRKKGEEESLNLQNGIMENNKFAHLPLLDNELTTQDIVGVFIHERQ